MEITFADFARDTTREVIFLSRVTRISKPKPASTPNKGSKSITTTRR